MDFLYEHHEVGESFPVDAANRGGYITCSSFSQGERFPVIGDEKGWNDFMYAHLTLSRSFSVYRVFLAGLFFNRLTGQGGGDCSMPFHRWRYFLYASDKGGDFICECGMLLRILT
jgi:hypothetical protein